MSGNIHGFGSGSNNNNNSNNNYRPVQMMGSVDNSSGNPREETFFSFLKGVCCPYFTYKSVIFFVSCVDLIMYIITLCFGIKMDATELLAPTYSTLDKFGMKVNNKIFHGQVWRWITFGLLHANFVHIFVNLFSQLIIGSMIEKAIGSFNSGLLYLFSSIGGGIFSSVVADASGVGASVAIFGMLGAYFGYMIINWKYLDRVLGPMNKFCNLIFMSFIVIMNISYGFSNPIIDNYGHIGGLIFGFFLIFVITKPVEENDGMCCGYKIWFYVSCVTLFILYVGGCLIFFLAKKIQ